MAIWHLGCPELFCCAEWGMRRSRRKRPMPNEAVEQATGGSVWQAKQVYAMAAVCLLLGLAIGYLFRGSQSSAPPLPDASSKQPAAVTGPMGGHMPSLDQMKQMADKKAAPLLEKLKSDPNNSDLLIQVENI